MIRINPSLLNYISKWQKQDSTAGIIEQTYQPKEQIIKAGKKCSAVYIIKRGLAKSYLTEDNGKDFIHEFFGEGELFGEVEFFTNNPSFCYIEAITEFTVYKLDYQHFQDRLETDKQFNQLVFKALANKISYKAHRHAYNQSHTIEENLLRLSKLIPNLTETIAKPDLASYLGITLRSLNRTLSDLKKKSLVN